MCIAVVYNNVFNNMYFPVSTFSEKRWKQVAGDVTAKKEIQKQNNTRI